MFQYLLLFIVGLALGIASFWGFQKIIAIPTEITPTISIAPPSPTFTYSTDNAPSLSQRAHIISQSGDLLWESRTATAPAQLMGSPEIQQGESIGTEKDSEAKVSLGDSLLTTLQENSLLQFTQTLPVSYVLTQRKGTITYTLSSRTQPCAIRVNRLLVRIENGTITIEIDEDTNTISVISTDGRAHIAYNDTDFETQYLKLSPKETFVYDIATRTGEIE